jgi:hypothetical protein
MTFESGVLANLNSVNQTELCVIMQTPVKDFQAGKNLQTFTIPPSFSMYTLLHVAEANTMASRLDCGV